MRKPKRLHKTFPWEHYVDEENKKVYAYIPGGYPTVLGLPTVIDQFFPGYKGAICTKEHLDSLKENNQ